ncbi:DNA-formamidopyrimidine glycosylase [Paenisporosarcina cavernae]|uniref:Formamidopyrimidine-DNA glycosylase n=1 Tax=Paenisporosarcina cavernae TaxID=2320858 RepID=A0A385YTF4_9BACL|nr:DNA-formamidopyrimidine glycosylase [Paenisporosarcina cavernae]AYC29824.1 DNA-formamidopyrimidine glycosylase [Paenisporosarcina cavernae]
MPELPEVEGVVRSLQPFVKHKRLEEIEISRTIQLSHENGKEAIIKGMDPDQFANALLHWEIKAVTRKAKYIYFHLTKEGNSALLVNHLGMTGAWFYVKDIHDIREEKFAKHRHVTFLLSDGHYLVYSDIRRFGELRLLENEQSHSPLLQIAPEPFDEKAEEFFIQRSKENKYVNKTIKETIMDGQVVSGCGNIYATEALYRMRILPTKRVKTISIVKRRQLFQAIVNVLLESIEAGGSSISDYRSINGEAGSMQDRLQMYGKKNCPTCGKTVLQKVIAGRNSWYCTSCQK